MILSAIGIPLLFLGILQVVNAALLLVGGLFTLVGVVLFLTGKTNPVVFPDIIVLEHSVTNHAGKALMVSDHQESLQHHSMHGDFADYRGHTPVLEPNESMVYTEPGSSPQRSASSLNNFKSGISSYLQALEQTPGYSFNTSFLTARQGSILNDMLFSCDELWQYGPYVTPSQYVDSNLMHQNTEVLTYLVYLAQSNNRSQLEFLEKYESEMSGYKQWLDSLESSAREFSGRVLESVRITYEDINSASVDASGLLLQSVDLKIQENTRKLEFEAQQKLEELEAKYSEMKEAIEATKDELQRAIESQDELVRSIGAQVASARSELATTPSEISFQVPYTIVSGGGGMIGQGGGRVSSVSSSIKYERVSMPNPAYASQVQSLKLVTMMSNIEEQRLQSLRRELHSADDLVTQKREKIESEQALRQEQYNQRMETERIELSKHSIKVERLYEDILENPSQIDVDDLIRLVTRSWRQPAVILESQLNVVHEEMSQCNALFHSFQEIFNATMDQILSGSPPSLGPENQVFSHWISVGGEVSGSIHIAKPISSTNPRPIHPADLNKSSVLLNPNQYPGYGEWVKSLSKESLFNGVASLRSNGMLDNVYATRIQRLLAKDPKLVVRR